MALMGLSVLAANLMIHRDGVARLHRDVPSIAAHAVEHILVRVSEHVPFHRPTGTSREDVAGMNGVAGERVRRCGDGGDGRYHQPRLRALGVVGIAAGCGCRARRLDAGDAGYLGGHAPHQEEVGFHNSLIVDNLFLCDVLPSFHTIVLC